MSNERIVDERISIKSSLHQPTFYRLVVLVFCPLLVVGLFVFAVYVFNHWHDFVGQSASIVSWFLLFGAMTLYVGLAWLGLKVVRAAIDAFIALADGSVGVYQRFIEARNAGARQALLHTGNDYVVYRQKGEIVVEFARQRNNYSIQESQALDELGTQQQPLQLEGPQALIPAPYTMSSMLQRWEPTKDGILLAKSGYEPILVPMGEPLCHTTFTGNTDSGKTNNERSLLIQLLYLEQICFLCDRNYSPLREDKKTGALYDYRPIEALLRYPAIDKAELTLQLLKYLVHELDGRRHERRKAGNAGYIARFDDTYLFMDELPAFCQEEPEIMDYVGRIVREARQYGIFFIGAAQDLLNATLKNDNGAVRDNLLTNYYGGGDMTTARLVLNLGRGETIDETGLGQKGIIYLRAKGAQIEKVKCRTGLSDNDATMLLLGDRVPVSQMSNIPVYDEDDDDDDGDGQRHSVRDIEALSTLQQMRKPKARRATLADAIAVWHEAGTEMGRPRLREMLLAKGLECSDDLAKVLIKNIKRHLEEHAGGGGDGAQV